ncbi:SIS domain-containing protein [Actinomadura darangshiensis]|uniref:SIS domain-containing protein n=1 Tax=Actinomadura darangshiensis TaxID=705336 RepID=A0A4R5BNW1_9ACTN|nr:SIS domain-containing protein [Actinomadura darangshiensis]TDD86860.1 SIS domain-containing protein [Actinomadura darangshiensis]
MDRTLGYAAGELDDRGAGRTAREIVQQPALWREVAKTVAALGGEHTAALRPLLDRRGLRIVLAGAGTSAYAGELLAPVLSRRLGRRVEAVASTELVADPHGCFAEDVPTLLVSFSRSGDSPEAVAATELADRLLTECHHLVVTCNPDGRLCREHSGAKSSTVLRMPAAANDQGFAMTSSFTCMVLGVLLVLGDGMTDEMVHHLATAAERALPGIADRARSLVAAGYERFVYLGGGPLRGLAHESALKLLELTAGQVLPLADSPLAFRHGPKAVLNDRTLAVVYVSNDPYTRRYDLDLVEELRRSLAPASVLALAAQDGGPVADLWHLPGLDDLDDALVALCYVLFAQVIALHASLHLGHRPDNPFPAQEVNRVVQGVTIHPLG